MSAALYENDFTGIKKNVLNFYAFLSVVKDVTSVHRFIPEMGREGCNIDI